MTRPNAKDLETGRRINIKAVQHLVIPAFNLQNIKLLTPRQKTAGLAKVIKSSQEIQQRTFKTQINRLQGRRQDGREGAEMGIEEVLNLIKAHPKDGGAG